MASRAGGRDETPISRSRRERRMEVERRTMVTLARVDIASWHFMAKEEAILHCPVGPISPSLESRQASARQQSNLPSPRRQPQQRRHECQPLLKSPECVSAFFIFSSETGKQLTHPIPALNTAPTAAKAAALTYPQSSRISSAATLLIMTAQLTALALLGRSYFQTNNISGKSFVKLLTSKAVLMRAECG